MNLKTHYANQITPQANGKKVIVAGWIQDKREVGNKLLFLILRDSKGICQVTFNKEKDSDLYSSVKDLYNESVISVQGTVDGKSKCNLGAEIIPEKVTVLSAIKSPFPLTLTKKVGTTSETEFKQRHLSIRMSRVVQTMEIKAEILKAARDFLIKEGHMELIAPIIVATATEGGSELFKVKYFNEEAYLAQSTQLYKQAAISAHERVFDIAPAFRAEKSKTTKHLTEFWQIDAETAFTDENDAIDLLERLITHICKEVTKNCPEQIKNLNPDFKVPKTPFKQYTFKEAIDFVNKLGFEESYEEDWSTPAELAMAEKHKEPFFVIDFPINARGVHYALNKKNRKITRSFDLIWPKFGEGATGGLREHEEDLILERMKQKKMDPKDHEWYLQLFRYGMPPHSGFGMGVERLTRWVCNLDHVREAVMFPRSLEMLRP